MRKDRGRRVGGRTTPTQFHLVSSMEESGGTKSQEWRQTPPFIVTSSFFIFYFLFLLNNKHIKLH